MVRVLNALNYGLIAGDSSSQAKSRNTTALQAILDQSNLGGGSSSPAKTRAHIPGGTYYFDNTGIVVRRQVAVSGDGPQATLLYFDAGCIAFYFQYGDVEVQPGKPGDSSHSIISDITIVGPSPSPQYTDVVNPDGYHGIFFQSGVLTFRNVYVFNFSGDGFRTDAGIGIPTGHNTASDQSRLEYCFSGQNKGWGFNINNGDDNNAILLISCLAQSNASGDFNESSFLGNTYVGGGSHSEAGGFKVTGDSNSTNKSVFVGVYHEGAEVSKIDLGCVAVGGLVSQAALRYPDNTGTIISNEGCKNLKGVIYKHNDQLWTPNTAITLNLHVRPTLNNANGRHYKAISIGAVPHQTGATEPIWPRSFGGTTLTVVDGNITWQEDGPLSTSIDVTAYIDGTAGSNMPFSLNDASAATIDYVGFLRTTGVIGGFYSNWWAHAWAGNTSGFDAQTYFFSTPDSSTGHVYTGRGIFNLSKLMLGNLYYGILFIDTADGPPPNPPGNGPRWQGDFRFNRTQTIGSPFGWTCVVAGNPGTWKPAGFVQDGYYNIIPQAITKWTDSSATEASAAAAKTQVRSCRKQTQTTTASANQVIDTGGTYGTEDFTLLNNATTLIDVTILIKKNGSPAGGSIKLSGTFYRDAGGNCVRVGTDDVIYKLVGSTLDATTADLNINGTKVEVRISPESADTLDLRIIRTQTEGSS